MHKVIRPFEYAADHINITTLKVGDELEFGDAAAGLEASGYITSDLNYKAPETGSVVDVTLLGDGSPLPEAETIILDPQFVAGRAAGENSEPVDEKLLEDPEFAKGFQIGKLQARSRLDLTDYDQLNWNELRELAAKLSDAPIKNKEEALTAIDTEVKRRAALVSSEEGKQGE